MINVNDFYREAYEYTTHYKRPFSFFNKYYIICTDRRADFGNVHLPWINHLLDSYLKYGSAGFTKDESSVNSLLDGLEALIASDKNKRFLI